MIRVLIADDHAVVRKGLTQFFTEEDDFEVVAQCADGSQVLGEISATRPDVVVLDLKMPRADGIAVLRQMKQRAMDIPAVLLVGNISDDEVVEALRLDVRGIVLKETAPNILLQAVRRVHEGETWLEKNIVGRAMERALQRSEGKRPPSVLTAREREIVKLAAAALGNRQIAEKLNISEGTVKTHLHSIYDKLGLAGRVQLLLYARENTLD